MSEKDNENLLYTIAVLGDTLQTKEFMLRVKDDMITRLEGELAQVKEQLRKEDEKETCYEAVMREEIEFLRAKNEELQERIDIMTEATAPESACEFPMSEDAPVQPSWEITPPVEVTEVTNVTKVIKGE